MKFESFAKTMFPDLGSWLAAGLAVLIMAFVPARAQDSELLPLPDCLTDPAQTAYLQRTITLFKTATPTNRPVIRMLVYGNSHSTREWWSTVLHGLIAKYPDIVGINGINVALVGLDASVLSYTARADITPWQPDIVFLTTYGRNLDDYRRLYRLIRDTTVADVVAHPEHPMSPEEAFDEPSEVVDPPYPDINYIRNYIWLPPLANEAGHCWGDIRSPWKKYLVMHQLQPKVLLHADGFHVNRTGSDLLAQLLLRLYDKRTFAKEIDPWNYTRIQTAAVGSRIHWVNGALDLKIRGNRVDVVYEDHPPVDSPVMRYDLDGSSPTNDPSLMGFDRPSSPYAVPYPLPGIYSIENDTPLLEETWRMEYKVLDERGENIEFSVEGSKTGFDGRGSSLRPFVSNSGRIKIDTGRLGLGLGFRQSKKHPPENFSISWRAERRFKESFQPKYVRPERVGVEHVETLFLSSVETNRTLRIFSTGGTPKGIKAVRVYSPAGLATIENRVPPPVVFNGKLEFLRGKGEATLSWPLEWGWGVLESNAALVTTPWVRSGVTPQVISNRFEVKVPLSDRQVYFRWKPITIIRP